MKTKIANIFLLLSLINIVKCSKSVNRSFYEAKISDYVFWPNGVVPFYIEQNHFDEEQRNKIVTALAMFTFNTCIKFIPSLAPPKKGDHVMVFENPTGQRKCSVPSVGVNVGSSHSIIVGYECVQSPKIEMILMKHLGFPFEHNRASRDLFIDVQIENVEGRAIALFTKENSLPAELRNLQYDVNSVMHFDERDFSKNGHRTIVFKRNLQRTNKKGGLSPTDVRKIDIVYGPECRKRDRQEKKDMCQSYPGVARRKRDTYKDYYDNIRLDQNTEFYKKQSTDYIYLGSKNKRKCQTVEKEGKVDVICDDDMYRKKREVADTTVSLRINKDITAPPNITESNDVTNVLKELGIASEVQVVVDQVYKIGALALDKARKKYCNESQALRIGDTKPSTQNKADIAGIVEVVAEYANQIVETALANLTQFCESTKSIESYQRSRCSFNSGGRECRHTYKSTKSGPVLYRTQHRPVIRQSTNHQGNPYNKNRFSRSNDRDINDTLGSETPIATKDRKKREIEKSENNDTRAENTTTKVLDKEQTLILRQKSTESEDGDVESHTFKDRPGQGTVIDWKNQEDSAEQANSKDSSKDFAKTAEQSESESTTRRPAKRKKHKARKNKKRHEKHYRVESSDQEVRSQGRNKKRQNEQNNYAASDSAELDSDSENGMEMAEKEEQEGKKDKEQKEEVSPKNERYIPEIVKLSKENEEFFSLRRWTEMEVPYLIAEDDMYDTDDIRRRLAEVNAILKAKTCVQIKEIDEEKAEGLQDFVVLNVSPDYVTGKVGGKQIFGSVELFKGGQHRQHAAMVVMAMLGFYFEISRHDRDKHIVVHMRHIRPDKLHHFEKIREDGTLPLPYDYESATHPAWQFWRKIGKTGISSVATFKEMDPDGSIMKRLGQNENLLSKIDLIKINSVYGVDCFKKRAQINEEI